MPSIAELTEIVEGKVAAAVIGISFRTLHRRRRFPIYIPNASGRYSRRQVELIADVEAGVYDAEQAYRILQAEHDAKRAQGAMVIAKAEKLRHKREKAGAAS